MLGEKNVRESKAVPVSISPISYYLVVYLTVTNVEYAKRFLEASNFFEG